MMIGIAFDLRSDYEGRISGGPDDRLEEYDSDATVQGIAQALTGLGHQVKLLGSGRRFVEQILREPPELVFNFAEGFGTRSREAHVPAVCEMLGVPVTHSDPLTLAVALDKAMCKRLVAAAGVPTPAYHVLTQASSAKTLDLRYPLIAKPVNEGSSMGIRRSSRVLNAAELERELERQLGDYAQPVLVEEFLPGVELTVGILGTGEAARVLGVMEIVPRHGSVADFVYSLEVKRNYKAEVMYRTPPALPPDVLRDIEQVALAAHRALDCRDVSRVDIRLDAAGKPHFIEVNPIPGLDAEKSDIVILGRAVGMGYGELLGAIVASALLRR